MLHAMTIGSDTAVSRFNTQQVVSNNTRVAGFAALAGGFLLTGTGTWDSFFPVSGILDFDNQTFSFTRDMIVDDIASIPRLGNIIGNFYTWDLAPTITCVLGGPSSPPTCLAMLQTTTFTLDVIETIDWTPDSAYVAVGEIAIGSGQPEIQIYSYNGLTNTLTNLITSTLDNAQVEVDLIRWNPTATTAPYVLAIAREKASTGQDELLLYQFTPPSTFIPTTPTGIFVNSIKYNESVQAVAWHPSGNFLAVAINNDSTSSPTTTTKIFVYAYSGGGINPTAVSQINIGSSVIQDKALDWSTTGSALAVGLNNPKQLNVYNFNGAIITNPSTPTTLAFSQQVNSLRWQRGQNNGIIGLAINNGTHVDTYIVQYIASTSTINIITSYTSNDALINSVEWDPTGSCFALGCMDTFQILSYNSMTGTLTLTYDEPFTGPNQETNEVRWTNNGLYIAKNHEISGTGNFHDSLQIYSSVGAGGGSSSACVSFSNINIYLSCNMCLDNACITFFGQSSIHGRGKCLSFVGGNITLQVAANSSLLLQDITMAGLQGMNIVLLDQTSTLSLVNVTWEQDGDFLFSNGKFDVAKDFHIIGQGTGFNYTSNQVSTIESNGRLILDEDVIFRYMPTSNNQGLINFVDSTAQMILRGASLATTSTSTGWKLTKGTLLVDQDSFIQSAATAPANAISFGDGINHANNLNVRILPAANLVVNSGFLVQNDV
jgi:hypothetical protein